MINSYFSLLFSTSIVNNSTWHWIPFLTICPLNSLRMISSVKHDSLTEFFHVVSCSTWVWVCVFCSWLVTKVTGPISHLAKTVISSDKGLFSLVTESRPLQEETTNSSWTVYVRPWLMFVLSCQGFKFDQTILGIDYAFMYMTLGNMNM